jgi:class 3 adenylate cyclase
LAGAASSLDAGREAISRHAWSEAFELLSGADAENGLSAEDLGGLAEAAWWTGRLDACIAARERAHSLHMESGARGRAAKVAMDLAKDYYAKGASSVASGWVKRAERLLEQEDEGVEHGYLARLHGVIAFEGMGDFDRALEGADRALEIATSFSDRDLQAIAIHDRGRALVAKGEVEEGLPLLDESAVAALSGELSPIATGVVYCNMITICEEVGDYRRAGQWNDAAKRWCERQAIAGFPGMCRVHRAEIMRLRGAWPEAEVEARRACEELREFNLDAAAEAFYEVGEVRLRVGDLEAAEQAFRQAHELGREPQPGLAQLRAAEGNLDSALASIRRALEDETRELHRARLLPAQVELGIAAGELEEARSAGAELNAIATRYGSAALQAQAACAQGRVLLATGDASEAVRSLRQGLRIWRELDVPYEAARARVQLASAYRTEGDEESSVMELRAAQAAFEQLGATPEERATRKLLAEWVGAEGGAATASRKEVVKAFMFTDIVRSTELVAAIGDEAWGDLVRWHDRTLRSLFDRHHGQEIDRAGDGFFVAFDDPQGAVACAVGVQRTLANHRRTSGFAPQVRIGIHRSAATQVGMGYGGRGVHEAARIAALASGSEILVTASTISASPSRFATTQPHSVTLKGLSEPVDVVAIDWS